MMIVDNHQRPERHCLYNHMTTIPYLHYPLELVARPPPSDRAGWLNPRAAPSPAPRLSERSREMHKSMPSSDLPLGCGTAGPLTNTQPARLVRRFNVPSAPSLGALGSGMTLVVCFCPRFGLAQFQHSAWLVNNGTRRVSERAPARANDRIDVDITGVCL